MSAIRPDMPAIPQPLATGPSAAARTAQAAFFRAALAGAEAATPRQQTQAGTTDEPQQTRSTRPGSLLDIRV